VARQLRAFVLASGPSGGEHLDLIKAATGLKIATNSTIFKAPWAHICFAMDQTWWRQYGHEVKKISCERISSSSMSARYGASLIPRRPKSKPVKDGVSGNNSATCAAELAYIRGAREIILVGVDCTADGKRNHHHDDHPEPLKNRIRTREWLDDWKRFITLNDVRVVNTSPLCEADFFEYADIREFV